MAGARRIASRPPDGREILTVAALHPNVLHALAQAAEADGRIGDAEALLKQAVELAPGLAAAHADWAQLLQRTGRSHEALALVEARIERFPEAVWPLSIKAALLDAERRTDESLPVHQRIVARIPHIAVAWVNQGQALRSSGRTEEAIGVFRKAIEVEPTNGAAWWALASIRTRPLGSADAEKLRRALESCTDEVQRVPLHFALGRALEDIGNFEQSLQHYEAGNRLRTKLVPPASRGVEQLVRRNQALFTREFLEARPREGGGDGGPIFIVGMPRSGSTLLEQILASHPQVEGLGELPYLDEIAREVGGTEGAARLGVAELAKLGERYRESAQRYRMSDRPFFTDKLPANWQRIGLIRLILPGARIIDVRRDPMACCFANFAFYFNRRTNYAAGLEDLGRYFLAYSRLADHFAALLPGQVQTVSYEELADDPEGVTRSVLAFLRLPFNPDCLRPFANERAVHTPSAEQVRQPIHREANRRWRRYAAWLEPLRRALEEEN